MSKKTKTTALVLMLIILTSKITGFFRDIVLAQTFGAGEITDAYLTALNIPVVLFDGKCSFRDNIYTNIFQN